MKSIYTILKAICLTMIIAGLSTQTSDAASIKKTEDLDFNGKKDNITVDYIEDAYMGRIYTKLNINGTIFDISTYNANKFDIIDINSKDKQKEIVLTSIYENISGDCNLFIYKNNKIEHLDEISIKGGQLSVNKKLNRAELEKYTNFGSEYIRYYEKYTIENGKLKNITTDEKNISVPDGKTNKYINLKLKMRKSLKAYTDAKMTKLGIEIKSGEIITVLAFNNKTDYFKIKNSSGKVLYVPIIVLDKELDGGYIQGFKQYKKLDQNTIAEVLR